MKKNSTKLTNALIFIGIIFLVLSLIMMLKNIKASNHIVAINYNEYKEKINEDNYNIILLTLPTCVHCKSYKEKVNSVADEYNLIIYELNINSLSYNEYIEIHDKYTVTKNTYSDNYPSILTPVTIITKGEKEITSISNDIGYNGFIKLLKENKIVK